MNWPLSSIRRKLQSVRKQTFAALYARVESRMEARLAPYRWRTAGQARGQVLEIGPGTGANLPYYSADVQLTVAEPNPHMARRLQRRAERVGRPVTLVTEVSQGLPFPVASFDSVVSTLVLCSVPDLTGELGEIRRVLRPGGMFYFFEHVQAQGKVKRALQAQVNPLHRLVADGCHLNRDIARAIQSAGFGGVEVQSLDVPLGNPLSSPSIVGQGWV